MTSKVTRLMPETGMDGPGFERVPSQDARPARPDPEVPERARRRTFTAKYKLEILAAYDAAADGEKGACCAARACTPATLVAAQAPSDQKKLAVGHTLPGRERGRVRHGDVLACSHRVRQRELADAAPRQVLR